MAESKDHPDVKILPPVLMLIFVAAAFFLNWLAPIRLPAPAALRPAGLVMLVITFGLGAGALRELSRAGTSAIPHEPTTAIVTSGVYSVTRNPIYLGFLLTVAGLPLVMGNAWGLILVPAAIPSFNALVIKPEEAYLERKFGSTYTDYTARVRRWI